MLKILHLVTSLDFGGLERRIEILSKYPSKNNELYFVALGGGGETHKTLLKNKSDVTLLECKPTIFTLKTFLTLLNLLRKVKPDIVHCHGCEANFYGVFVSKILRVKLIVAEEIGIPSLSVTARFIFRLVYKISDKVICMSPAVLGFLSSEIVVDKKNLTTVYNPVLMKSGSDVTDRTLSKALCFVYLGRLEEVKNPLGLLAAFNQFINEGYEAELTIIGDGSQKNELISYITENELNSHVHFLGFVSLPLDELIKHDVIIQPSHTEGFSLALAEAMSCCLPALCTPSGSANVLIKDGVNGWLMKSSDVSSIYDGLVIAFNNKDNLNELGRKARETVINKHSAKQYAEKLDFFYDSLLGFKP